MINLNFVKVKNKLKVQQYNSDLFNAITAKIKEIDNYQSLRTDNELIKFVCTCIENALIEKYETKNNKTDKKKLAMDIICSIFTFNETEKAVLGNAIDFLCDNKMIVKYSNLKKYSSLFGEYLYSKL